MLTFQRQIAMWLGLVAFSTAMSQTPAPTTPPPAPEHTPIVEVMKKTVVFLEADCRELQPDGTMKISPHSGTAFLMSVADPRLKDGAFTYLVTNRHVAQPGVEDGRPCDIAGYRLRADSKSLGPNGSYSVLQGMSANVPWAFSTDRSDDLAITPIGLNAEKLDIAVLPSDLLLRKEDVEKNHIVEGDSVIFTGLFIQLVGQSHSEPIVREGKIAMMPREQIPTTLRSLGDVYLVDSHVFGGNSGSPMFVNLAGQREGGMFVGINYRLLGVVSGYIQEDINLTLQPVAAYAGTVTANSGIAMVVPAQKILDILDSPQLKMQRDREVAEHLKQFSTAPPKSP